MTPASRIRRRQQRGVTMMGLLFWAILVGIVALVAMKVFPTLTEYWAIKRAVHKVAQEGGTSVPEIRMAFEKQKAVESNMDAVSSGDLEITKVNDKVVVRFAYDKEVVLVEPVYLLIKYSGSSE
ncbi:DUF4845 domain-containing protein [Eleftheria terrae]|uniref:DUF4845 domain-containing protein n=1 Tax=Eleftheria terrae TaxID=1597781 RepID=UPI00263A55CF|nr:DUF4845 domain-containing protein [Eleftheria terrae]WKB54582.1 DUF4845 domain-containing protein [Eleftheria terrae]